jgi:hypothetical protein
MSEHDDLQHRPTRKPNTNDTAFDGGPKSGRDKPDILAPGQTPPPKPRRVAQVDPTTAANKQGIVAYESSAEAIATTLASMPSRMIQAADSIAKNIPKTPTERGPVAEFAQFDADLGAEIAGFVAELRQLDGLTAISEVGFATVSQDMTHIRDGGIGYLVSLIANKQEMAGKYSWVDKDGVEHKVTLKVTAKDLYSALDGIEANLRKHDKESLQIGDRDKKSIAIKHPDGAKPEDVVIASARAGFDETRLLRVALHDQRLGLTHKLQLVRRAHAFASQIRSYRKQHRDFVPAELTAIRKFTSEVKLLSRETAKESIAQDVQQLDASCADLDKRVP